MMYIDVSIRKCIEHCLLAAACEPSIPIVTLSA